ncbi:MAG: peptidylprolyl isomerase [Flavobacteriaceae bacterium]|nr:peptidylprolyl isomerase [Flavobacteriaceae bacterium]
MLRKTIASIALCLIGFYISAQDLNDKVLIDIDGDKVKVGEFLRVYQKNLDLVKDDSQKDIDGYLKLYTNYLLKLKEAYALKYDQRPDYKREFQTYKKQLSKNYLTDKTVTEKLVREAYDRMSQDVQVKHILIRLEDNETDTTAVYNQIMAFRERLINEDFESIRRDSHNGSSVFVEDLGYFSAFKMVYPFESVAYNTEVGAVSMPFRTRFGYHVLKVFDKRKSRGEVTVGHIFLSKNTPDSIGDPAERIQNIYKMIGQGKEFEDLAKQFSEDKSSSQKGGRLNSFKSGQLSSVKFEDMAFSLETIGEISIPFETDFGWHISKLYEKKPIGSFDELRPQVEARVKRDARSAVINESFIDSLKAQYNVSTDVDLSYFATILNDGYFKREWVKPDDLPKDKGLISIGTKDLSYVDFAVYLEKAQKRIREKKEFDRIVDMQFDSFVNEQILDYHESNLENINKEYAQVLTEYRDGLLLFDLMEDKIWNAVKEDTVGLKNFYEKNRDQYHWPERYKGVLVSSGNKKVLKEVKTVLQSDNDFKEIRKQFESKGSGDMIWTNRDFTKGTPKLPADLAISIGTSEIFEHNGTWHVLKIDDILPAGPKSFDEAKGKLISDYQAKMESEWMEELAGKYTLTIDDKVLSELKSSINKR